MIACIYVHNSVLVIVHYDWIVEMIEFDRLVVGFIRIRYTFVVVGMFSKYLVGNKLHKERETKGGSKTNGKREREEKEREHKSN